jgi:peptidoglycan/LPS O-acetylase OafA/YrhL
MRAVSNSKGCSVRRRQRRPCVASQEKSMTTPQQSPSLAKYRPDIDGLRAFAVVSVVAYHAFPKLLPGGFIGVDIFFVISGFLITTIVLHSLAEGAFTYRSFYARRIRRIFPALIVVLLATLCAGWYLLLSDEFAELGKQATGGSAFVANLIFWSESGYFDTIAETKPLLHLWSLGIEEQFYIFWPLLLGLAWRKRWPIGRVILAVSAVSMAINVAMVQTSPSAAFYSPASRFWELMIGGILACMRQRPPAPNIWRGHVQSVLGIGLIVLGLVMIRSNSAFPGWWALLPTLGAASCIAAGPDGALNKYLLSNRVMVWIGLISYPLYLWHWPLLAFPRIIGSEAPSPEIKVIAVLAALTLAWLTYVIVEKRVRAGFGKSPQLIVLSAAMAFVGFFGTFVFIRNGLPSRDAAQLAIINSGDVGHEIFHKYLDENFYPCTPVAIQRESLKWGDHLRCFQSKNQGAPSLAIIGDSHGEHLFVGLAEAMPDRNIVYYIKDSLPYSSNKEFNRIFASVLADSKIVDVILASLWKERLGAFGPEIQKTVHQLTAAHKKVFLIDDVPTFSFDPKKCKYSRLLSSNYLCSEPRSIFDGSYRYYLPVLQAAVDGDQDAKILFVSNYLCDEAKCHMAIDGKLLYRDNHHLNLNGSRFFGNRIIEQVPELVGKSARK